MRKAIGPVALLVLVVGVFFGLKFRYGNYTDYYYVKADLPRAGQLLRVGTDVRERGVIIGKVSDIELVNLQAEVTMQIEPTYKIPRDVHAFVALKTLLGDKYIDLRTDRYARPWLADGAKIQGVLGPELEDVIQSGTSVFHAINPDELATVVDSLYQGAKGHGEDVAKGFQANAELLTVFATSLSPQIRALNDFAIIFGTLKSKAIDLNRLADAVNEGAPVYASARAHTLLRRALTAIKPFADNLADLLIFQKPDWDRMMDNGDKVLQLLSMHTSGLHDLIQGLYIYVHHLGGPAPLLSDGSAEAAFSNFSGGEAFQQQVQDICGGLPPPLRKQIPICQQARYQVAKR